MLITHHKAGKIHKESAQNFTKRVVRVEILSLVQWNMKLLDNIIMKFWPPRLPVECFRSNRIIALE